MVLILGVMLAPLLLGIAGASLWKGLRTHRPRLLIVAVIALAFEALVIAAGVWQTGYVVPTDIAERDAPGTYVRLGHDARDEVRLLPDGSFLRTAEYRGVTQHQSGRWRYVASQLRGAAHATIDFENASPPCLRSTAPPGALVRYGEPDEALCQPSVDGIVGASWCRVRGRGLALCLGDDGFEYLRQ